MSNDDDRPDFERTLRDIAQEVTKSFEKISEADRERGKEWFDTAASWLRTAAGETAAPAPVAPAASEPLHDSAEPHPLDVPTEEQGVALAALDSGRWALEPGTSALSVVGDGPGPSDALGLVRALVVRDWLRTDGALTLAGLHALERWLDVEG